MPPRFKDYLPGSATHLAHMLLSAHQQHALYASQSQPSPSPPPGNETPSPRSESPPHSVPFTTEPNFFGLYRIYPNKPTHIPQDSLEIACDAPSFHEGPSVEGDARRDFLGIPSHAHFSPDDIFAPFSNPTSGIYLAWNYFGLNLKSGVEADRFAQLQQDHRYKTEELKTFSFARETRQLVDFLESKANPFRSDYGWRKSSVEIKLPKENMPSTSESDAPQMTINGVWHRDIIDVITNAFQSEAGLSFNMMPFRQQWKISEHKTVDVFSESYSSPEMLCAHEEISALPHELGDDMERIVASLMFWSDSTQVTQFGNNSMWPFYLSFGNQSKYSCGKPSAAACHHLAYIPKVCVCSYISMLMLNIFLSFPITSRTCIARFVEFLQSKMSLHTASVNYSRRYGTYYSTTSLWMRIAMALSFNVLTGLLGRYTPVFFPIRQITQRSIYTQYVVYLSKLLLI